MSFGLPLDVIQLQNRKFIHPFRPLIKLLFIQKSPIPLLAASHHANQPIPVYFFLTYTSNRLCGFEQLPSIIANKTFPLIIKSNQMDFRDFEGLLPFKLLNPFLNTIGWVLMFIGPAYFNVTYRHLCIFGVLYFFTKAIYSLIITMIATFKVFRALSRKDAINTELPSNEGVEDLIYLFIIPSYCEDINLIGETLDTLGSHRKAKSNYIIFLAMEGHEVDADKKAKILIEKYKSSFRMMDFSRHILKAGEQKGKASNVSWCAEHLDGFFKQNLIEKDDVFLTIIDADSWAPGLYIDEVERYLSNNWEKRHRVIFQPPQFYTRNELQVSMFTRVCDIMHSMFHYGTLFSIFNITFPLSNYTLSYKLIERVGFWDTCPDAIGQDFHTTQKCFWKTGGDVVCVPIYVFFNQVNVATGKGLWEDVKARFWQCERHSQGQADVSYNLKSFITNPFNFRTFLVCSRVVEVFCMVAIIPSLFIGMNRGTSMLSVLFSEASLSVTMPPEAWDLDLSSIFNIFTLLGFFNYFFYDLAKRKSTRELYGLEPAHILRSIEFIALSFVLLYAVNIPAMIIASFRILFSSRVYVTAEKIQKKDFLGASSEQAKPLTSS